MHICEQILDLARWAPSGDNTQPWRFEIKNDYEVVVHGFDTRDHCVYDLDGHPSQMALGALLETIDVAASAHGLKPEVRRRRDMPDEKPTFDVTFKPDPLVKPSPLLPTIAIRSVQRRPLSTRPLTESQKRILDASVGPDHAIKWFETFGERWQVAMLLFHNAKIRLTMREAYEVHCKVIAWNSRFSEDRIPDQAIGVDPITAKFMHWVMKDWSRAEFFNKYFAGTIMPRLQLDLIPGLACGAHVALVAKTKPASIDHYVESGRAMQRLWLTATSLDLRLQPEMTPVIFSRYDREGVAFTANSTARAMAREIADGLAAIVGRDGTNERVVFLARVGSGSTPVSRSTRLPLTSLIIDKYGH